MGTEPDSTPVQPQEPTGVDGLDLQSGDYDPSPHYLPVGGAVLRGWPATLSTIPAEVRVLAVDGPAVLDWLELERRLSAEISTRFGRAARVIRTEEVTRPWEEIRRLTDSSVLEHDRDFATVAGGELADLLDLDRLADLTSTRSPEYGVLLVLGPGSALCEPDVLWWADLPKRCAEKAVGQAGGRNLAAPAGMPATTRRLFYIDWPLLDRHRDRFVGDIDRWIDTQDAEFPTSLSGTALRATAGDLARRPFRTRPYFNSTSWGGHWGQQRLGHNPASPNTALGYELIAPESGVLVGSEASTVEVPFQLLVALAPMEILGEHVHALFGDSFPIRFDYLDTVGGGNLSVHCHPQPEYMREVFGWPYTQHETYYMMQAGPDSSVFLGLRADASVEDFERAAHAADEHGTQFDITRYVQVFRSEQHQLFLIPAGTPHGSGEGNVVLEISATPYLYSLRFYDWLRKDATDQQRPVHVEHAFRNLDRSHSGSEVSERLVQRPRRRSGGDGWDEVLIGSLPEMFFEVSRVQLDPGGRAELGGDGRFEVLTVVSGAGVHLDSSSGRSHALAYAETLIVPAAAGRYTLLNGNDRPVWLVRAFVR